MSAQKPESHKRGYYGVVLVVGVALSVAGNALHARAVTGGSTLAAVGAAIFPVLLLMMTELTMLTAKRFAGWVRGVTAGLAAVVAAISFAISYEALAYAARELFGIGAWLSWLAPLTVDLPIIAATLALWAASDLIRRDRGEQSSTDRTTSSGDPDERSIDQPDDQSDSSVVEQPIGRTSTPYEQRSTGPELAVQRSTEPDETPPRPIGRPDEVVPDEVSDDLADQVVEQVGRHSVDRTSSPYEHSIGRSDDESDESWAVAAERVRAATGITAEPDELATVLEMADSGESRAAIAAAVGRSKSTVSGWINKAAEVNQPGRPELSAVR